MALKRWLVLLRPTWSSFSS